MDFGFGHMAVTTASTGKPGLEERFERKESQVIDDYGSHCTALALTSSAIGLNVSASGGKTWSSFPSSDICIRSFPSSTASPLDGADGSGAGSGADSA